MEEKQKRQIIINAATSFVRVVVSGAILFVLYGFLLKTVGAGGLGVWSVVLAATSIANIGNLGLSASVVKFVAKHLAHGEKKAASEIIQTSAITIGFIMALVLVATYPFVGWILGLVVPGGEVGASLAILPYAMISLWLLIVGNVFQSGVEGCQRVDLRNFLLMAGAVLNLVLSFWWVPSFGLMGLAYAQAATAGLVLLCGWGMIRRQLPELPVFPYQWSFLCFRKMLGYGVNFQIVTIFQFLYDPITKSLVMKFGGLPVAGFYEMASGMVMKFRELIVAAHQVLVPAIADLKEKKPEIIQDLYRDSYRLIVYFSLPFFSGIIAFTPLFSQIWIGHYENSFVQFSMLLAFGWLINTITAPAFFVNLGLGDLAWNTVAHAAIATLNLFLGFIFGGLFGGGGVVVGWVAALIIGSLVIPVSYHLRHGIPMGDLFPREHLPLLIVCFLGTLGALASMQALMESPGFMFSTAGILGLFLIFIYFPIRAHPMRKRITKLFSREIFRPYKLKLGR